MNKRPKTRLVWQLYVDGKLFQSFQKKPPKEIWNMQRLKGIEIRVEEVKE